MLTRVDHIDIRTPDIEATLSFLKKLGLREVRRLDPDRGSVEVALPGDAQVVFELRPDDTAAQAYVHHVAFGLESNDDVDSLREAGVAFGKEKHFVAATGRTVSNSVDPAGMTWQFTD